MLIAGAQGEFQSRESRPQFIEHIGQMIPKDQLRRPHAQARRRLRPQFGPHFLQVGKERFNELVQLLARRSECKRAACEELHRQIVFQAQQLGADGRLLNSVGHLSNGFHDAAVPGHVIKKLDVVDIHGGTLARHHRFYQWLCRFFSTNARTGPGCNVSS